MHYTVLPVTSFSEMEEVSNLNAVSSVGEIEIHAIYRSAADN